MDKKNVLYATMGYELLRGGRSKQNGPLNNALQPLRIQIKKENVMKKRKKKKLAIYACVQLELPSADPQTYKTTLDTC